MNPNTATEYRNLPLTVLIPSKTNPRRIIEDDSLRELAESISVHGVLEPLIVRPVTERDFEVVVGGRRFAASKKAGKDDAPCSIRNLTDAQVLEIQLVENLQRRDVHPMEEAHGFHALLKLEEPKYTIEQIGAKVGKAPAYVASRARLTELIPAVVEAFYAEEIGVGHALLLAKLQPAQQEAALASCFREDWGGGAGKAKRIVLPIRHLQYWIEHNVLLLIKQAPFDKRNAQLLPAAGSCVDCPKRTGHNKLLFSDVSGNADACTDPVCYAAKLEAYVQKQIAAKPEIVQISTAYGKTQDGSKYVEIRADKPDTPAKAKQPEFKTCKFIAEAIVSEGIDKGEVRRVCAEANCPIHHPKKPSAKADASFKAEQDKSRREHALANATGMRVLQNIVAAVPVRLMKKDFLFVAEQMLPLLDDKRLEMVARNRGIRAKEGESAAKLLMAFVRKAEEGVIGNLIVEAIILLSASKQSDGGKVLRAAAQAYKVNTDAVALKVKHEFSAKEKARQAPRPIAKAVPKIKKAA